MALEQQQRRLSHSVNLWSASGRVQDAGADECSAYRQGYGVGLATQDRRGAVTTPAAGTASRPVTTTITLGVLVLAFIAGFVILAANGRDTVEYIVFASGPAVSAVVGAILARHQSVIAADVAAVRHQTNQLMTDQFAEASAERQSIAAGTVTVTQGPDTAVKG